MFKTLFYSIVTGLCLQATGFNKPAQQLLEKYCYDCHSDGVDKGGFEFEKLMKLAPKSNASKKQWEKIWTVVEEHQMPPANKKKQPTQAEREQMMIAIEQDTFSIRRSQKYAGPIELVRLSNEQYANTVKDLTGYWGDIKNKLPIDPTSAGFNNISSTLTLSPALFDRYNKIATETSRGMFIPGAGHKNQLSRGQNLLEKSANGKDPQKVRDTLFSMAQLTYRRELTEKEKITISSLYKKLRTTMNHREAMQKYTQSLLVSPNFIFRTELLGVDKTEGHLARLDETALASRLAFFLWNSAPSQNLLNLARQNKLRKNLKREVKYMIKDWRFQQMARSFGLHWLGIQYLDNNIPSRHLDKSFQPYHLIRMQSETSRFLRYIFQENKPINELFTSRESFIDHSLAALYKLPKPKKSDYQKVTIADRRGLLTQPSVLIVTSDPDRTSPVKRGMWLLENILGMPPPPAPADVPSIESSEKGKEKLSFRQKLEKHRDNKACASCHAMMDPLGFAMENYGPLGRWRTKDHGLPVDSKSNWRGHEIKGFKDLSKLLTTEYRDEFLHCFTEKLMTYALGRGLEIEDRITIMKIVDKVKHQDSRFHDIFIALIESTPFQYRTIAKEKNAK